MIPQTQPPATKQAWQRALASSVKDPAILLKQLKLTGKLTAIDNDKIKGFRLKVPQHYISNMRVGDARDPLLRQIFPLIDEAFDYDDFNQDPVGDHLAITSPGLLQKYEGRALLLTTGACAIHCRYCFRRHFSYSQCSPLGKQWQQTITELKNSPSIREVILSGGDPLVLDDNKLAGIAQSLASISHLKRLRIHTRLPIVLPERIDSYLLAWLKQTRLKVVIVIHANHANEIDDDVALALSQLSVAGCQLFNQTVMLKGVNDDTTSLYHLSERLSDVDVTPYYLHLLDKVKGARHFYVSDERAIEIMKALRQKLPGYLVPRLVRETQGAASKTVIS